MSDYFYNNSHFGSFKRKRNSSCAMFYLWTRLISRERLAWQNIVITLSMLIPILSHNYSINIHWHIVRVFAFFFLVYAHRNNKLIVEKALVKIIAGDFNCVTDPRLNKLGGNPHACNSANDVIIQLSQDHALLDIWHELHKNKRAYTWTGKKPYGWFSHIHKNW